jgi:hypothetical protein
MSIYFVKKEIQFCFVYQHKSLLPEDFHKRMKTLPKQNKQLQQPFEYYKFRIFVQKKKQHKQHFISFQSISIHFKTNKSK